MTREHNGKGHAGPNPGMPQYRITVQSLAGAKIECDWVEVEQSLQQMETRVAEFFAMLKNHCYQLTLDDEFVGNFRRYHHVEEWAKTRPGSRAVVIECFPTSAQKCLDD